MEHSNVSNCIGAIVASFSSGLNVFKKFRKTRRRRNGTKGDPNERRLTKSLYQGQEEIGREYQKRIQTAGYHFAVGDAIAQTSLAEILLKLNTGLVSIISSFLKRDENNLNLDYGSLTNLSERSRIDTCKALRQLHRRSTRLHPQPALQAREPYQSDRQPIEPGHKERKPRQTSRPRGPVLARVTIENSSQPPQIAQVKPSERRKKSRSSSNLSSAKLPSKPPPQYTPESSSRPAANRTQTAPPAINPKYTDHRPQNRASNPTPKLSTSPQTQALHSYPLTEPRRAEKLTPTYYSIRSDSTKLGEIPLHKWAAQPDFEAMSLANREAERSGWPVQKNYNGEKRKGGFWGFLRGL